MQEKDDSRVVTQDYGCIIRNLEKKKKRDHAAQF